MTYFNWWEFEEVEPRYCPIAEEKCSFPNNYCEACEEFSRRIKNEQLHRSRSVESNQGV